MWWDLLAASSLFCHFFRNDFVCDFTKWKMRKEEKSFLLLLFMLRHFLLASSLCFFATCLVVPIRGYFLNSAHKRSSREIFFWNLFTFLWLSHLTIPPYFHCLVLKREKSSRTETENFLMNFAIKLSSLLSNLERERESEDDDFVD